MEREDFMAFFRSDEKLNLLTADDRIEIFFLSSQEILILVKSF